MRVSHLGKWTEEYKHLSIDFPQLFGIIQIMNNKGNTQTSVALFQEKTIRRIWHNDNWHFSVIDVIAILTNSTRPRKYWNDLKNKLIEEGYIEVSEKIGQLKMESPDGKMRETDTAEASVLLRIIQSIPSPKAEPFKRWLAEVGNQRLQEIDNPELAMERMKMLYKQKGYPKEWVEKRMRGIAVRNELTEEWDKRGAKEKKDYAILTNEIALATFGIGIKEHKQYKTLKQENLRDHMTDIELILTMLGEATATTLHRERDSKNIPNLRKDAKDAGGVAGRTRQDIEAQTGKKVISSTNYRDLPEKSVQDKLENK